MQVGYADAEWAENQDYVYASMYLEVPSVVVLSKEILCIAVVNYKTDFNALNGNQCLWVYSSQSYNTTIKKINSHTIQF